MKKERTGKYRRIFAVFLCMCILFTTQPEIGNGFSVFAADLVDSGECGADGDNVTWTLDADGVLTISGSGAMYDYGERQGPFYNRNDITKVIIEDGVTRIGELAFESCKNLTDIEIPDSVTSIGYNAFYYCESLETIEIPSSVTSIETQAFFLCKKLQSIKIPSGVTSIEEYTFSSCNSLKSVEIPSSVTSIGEGAFLSCMSLTDVTIPDSVTSIGRQAFYACMSLTDVTIPDSVESIDSHAFGMCLGLATVSFQGKVPPELLGEEIFESCDKLTAIYIPSCQYLEAYRTAEGLSTYQEKITASGHGGYTYTAAGTDVTQTCACGSVSATATLSIKEGADLNYTGSAITPAEVTYSDDWVEQDDTLISYENNIDPGTATAKLTIGGATVQISFTIAPPPYHVTLHTNEGTGGTDLTSYTYGTGAALPTDWTKTGYTFAGWYDNESFTGTAVTEISTADIGDKEYWAKWTANTYQVTFDYHGADGGDTTQSKDVTYDSTYGVLPVPSRTGYTFKGWYTETDGQGSKVGNTTLVTATSAHTLHAYWKDETAPDWPVLQNGETLPAGWTNTQDTIPLNLYDGVGVTELWVSIDGKDYIKVDGFSGGTGSINYNYAVGEGEHTYQFKAVDAAGNTSAESAVFTVKLDQIKPVIGTITYENDAANLWQWIIGKTSMIVHVPVTETGSGVKQISYTLTPRDAAGNLDSSKAEEKTAAVSGGEAKIVFDADFRGTVTINCMDAAGNKADGVIIGKDAGGVIVEDHAPDITTDARTDYYDAPTAVNVTVKDDTNNAVTAGIAAITYKVGDDTEKSVTVDTSALQAEVTFTIPESEIPTGITEIEITAKDNAGNEAAKSITVKVKGPEKQPVAKSDYQKEELTGLVPDGIYSINGTEIAADQEGCIPIDESWFGTTVIIVRNGNGNETTDSPAQSLSVPARPVAPDAPELSVRDDKSITLKTITGAQYRRTDGTGNWQDGARFEGLNPGTVYSFTAYYPATDTGFASAESSPAQIATVPTAPTPDKLAVSYTEETFTLHDGVEAFTDQSCTTPVTAGSVEAYMGQTIYIRYPADGIIPESPTTPVPIPTRPAKPAPGKVDASYPGAKDGAITGLTDGTAYEYRVKDQDGNFGAWQDAALNGTKIENLPAGEYEVRVKAVETGNVSFRSEAAAVTVGENPGVKVTFPPQPTEPSQQTPQPPSPTNPLGQPQPTEKPDGKPGTVPGTPGSQPEDKQEPESTGTPESTEKPSETEKEQQPEGDGEQTISAAVDNGKIVISGEPVATGNVEGMADTSTVLKVGNGAVIVTVACTEQEYTAGVADTLAVANAVLTPEQIQLVNNGETIEIRIDVKDISDRVPEQDKEVLKNGIEEYRKEVPGLVLGRYVDISMLIRIGEGDWNAITETEETIDIIIGIPEKLQEKGVAYYIIRAHDGAHTLMDDMDDDPSTITVSTDRFSSYAIAYVQAEGTGHKCGLCHICPTFLGVCCFVWLAIIILIMIVVIILLRKKKEEQEARDARQ